MKRIIRSLTVFVLLISFLIPLNIYAAGASADLTGPGNLRAGDTVTLSFNLHGSGIYGASGTLSYDSSQVTLSSTAQKIGSSWAVEFSGKNFVAYDNNLSNPIKGTKTLFTVTFKVKSVAAGTNIKISYTNVTASDGNSDKSIGTVTYSKNVSAPLSANNSLASLECGNATLSPNFSSEITSYTASVPFETSKLNITAKAADGKAKVSVGNTNLTPGSTTKITVTVTAENGAKKTYTVSVKRAQDPNYKPGDNNKLSGISVKGFLLSPKFTAENTDYVVWLPYETESIEISGSASDGKASVEVIGGDKLTAGEDNPVKIICTAENGDKKTYTVNVKRAAAHGITEETPDKTEQDDTSSDSDSDTDENSKDGISQKLPITVGIVALAAGVAIGYFGGMFLNRKRKHSL